MAALRSWLPALLALLAALAWLFHPLWVGALVGEPRFFEWDVPEQYWPDLVYLCRHLHAGELPWWNPLDRGGYPYYADPQSGQYHPLNYAICAVAGPDPSLFWAELRVVLGFALAGLGGLVWLRGRRAPWAGAIGGAVLLMAAPYMRHNWELNLTLALGFWPWMLWAVDRLLRHRRVRDAVLFAWMWALCAWVGSPPSLWLASSFTMLYGLVSLAAVALEERAAVPRLLALSGLAGVLGIGLFGAVLVPGLTLAEFSVQQDQSWESITRDALTLSELRALVSPRPGNHLYLGLPTLALALLALGTRTGRWAWLAALLAVGLTLGANGPVFGLAWHLPGVSMFRLPHRYEAWLGPAAALWWVEGARVLERRLGTRLGPWVGGVAALLLLADITRAMPSDRHTRARPAPGQDPDAVLAAAPDTDADWRYFDEFGISCRSGTRLGRRDLRGYQDPLNLKATERLWSALRERPELLSWFNVRYVLTGPHFIHGWDRQFLPPREALLSRGWRPVGAGVLEVPDALPRAWFTSRAEWVPDRPAALLRLSDLEVGGAVVLDGEHTGAEASVRPMSGDERLRPWLTAEVQALSSDALEVRVDAPRDGWVVVSEAFYPGWQAHLDGEEVTVWRANALVQAVHVEAGSHRLELRFSPPDGRRWRWIWLMSLAGSLLLLLVPGGLARWRASR